MRLLLFLPLLALPLAARAQLDRPQPTGSDVAAKAVLRRLALEVAQRSGWRGDEPDAKDVLGRVPRDLVFLVDVSESSSKEAYTTFVKDFIRNVVTLAGKQQTRLAVTPEARHLVAVYPYQLRLITDKEYALDPMQLASSKLVGRIVQAVPTAAIDQGRGHDSSGARASLLKRLGPGGSGSAKPLVVQITNMEMNQDPDHPQNDALVRRVDARVGGLAGTGFAPYGEGDLFYTEEPGPTIPPYPVHVWLYGPERFSPVAHTSAAPPPPPPGGGSLLPFLGVLTALVALGAGVLSLLGKKGYVVSPLDRNKHASGGQRVAPGQSVPIRVEGTGVKDAILVPRDAVNGLPPGTEVGRVACPKGPFGGPTVSGTSPFSLRIAGDVAPNGTSRPLTGGQEYVFDGPNGKTNPFRIQVSR